MEKVSGHTRLYRRESGTYYHRAVVPQDIRRTYGKREEKFSLKTKDYTEALRLVRVAAVEVDHRFDEHRLRVARQAKPLDELTAQQLVTVKATYLHHLLDEDEETRLGGFEELEDGALVSPLQYEPRPTFEEYEDNIDGFEAESRFNLARGRQDEFFRMEAEDVLSWDGIDVCLSPSSPSWGRLIRALQEASVEAAGLIRPFLFGVFAR